MNTVESFKAPHSLEEKISLEKEKILEVAHEGRYATIKNYYARMGEYIEEKIPESVQKTVSSVANYTFVADFKFAAEGIKGETFGGRPLSPTDRMLYLTTAFLSLGGKALMAYGKATDNPELVDLGGKGWGASWFPGIAVMGPDTWETIRSLATARKFSKFISLMDWFESIPDTLKERARNLANNYGPKQKNA